MSDEPSASINQHRIYQDRVPQHQTHHNNKEVTSSTEETLAKIRRLREERKQEADSPPSDLVADNTKQIKFLIARMDSLEENMRDLTNETKKTKECSTSSSHSRSFVKDLISPKKDEIDQLKALVEKQAITISRLEKQVETLKNEVNQSSGALRPTVEPYLILGNAVLACPSTKELIEPYLPLENTKNVVLFVGLVGSERSFAQLIYNAMKKYKSTEKTAITPSEKALFVAVNDFYKKRDDIEFDVLVLPEETGKFNKLQFQDSEKPGNTAFRQYTEVYVPIVMKDEKSVGFRGVVKGKS